MAGIGIGTKCTKNCGRDEGESVEITKIIDSSFVMVKNEKGKESKCAIVHLEPSV
ncbi:MAG: 50S ribosomal protein L14e [Candidatus Micrarchaeia archaeon]